VQGASSVLCTWDIPDVAHNLDTLSRVDDGEGEALLASIADHWPDRGEPTRPIALDPTGAFAVARDALHAEDGSLEVRSLNPRCLRARLRPLGSPVSAAAVTSDGRTVVSAQFDHGIKVWDLTRYEGRASNPPRGHVDWIVLFPEDGVAFVNLRLAVGAEPQMVAWGA
jgi:hypothetical protein